MEKLTKCLSVWIDETTDSDNPKWIVSRDEITSNNKTETTQTLKVFDEYDDAVRYAKTKAHDLELNVYETENTPSAKNELIYQPFRKIEIFQIVKNKAIWVGEGRVLNDHTVVDCAIDFGDETEVIFEKIEEDIEEEETDGKFEFDENEYCWEIIND